MKNPCFDENTKTDCPRRGKGCSVGCPEWTKYVKERDISYQKRMTDIAGKSLTDGHVRRIRGHIKK